MTAAGTLFVKVGGLPLEVVELEGRPDFAPLVLLHQGLGSARLWRGFPAALHQATGRRLITFSRYGHGRSAPPPRPRTPAFFHEEALEVLPELLEQLEAREPVLVGHSDGGSIALIHGAHHPVSALVLLAPHVFVEEVTIGSIQATRRLYLESGLRERMSPHHDDPDAAFWGWCDVWLDPGFRAWSLEEDAAGVTAPTLLIQGADDPYGSLEQLDRIEARVRGPVRRLVVAGDHSPHLQHTDRLVAAIADFLSPDG